MINNIIFYKQIKGMELERGFVLFLKIYHDTCYILNILSFQHFIHSVRLNLTRMHKNSQSIYKKMMELIK